ncbi:MAG: hypothetical protein KDA28_13220 [Phycisphaerales bacterium]|nr:hypothetical protein [Phycisphaerales bacterium]
MKVRRLSIATALALACAGPVSAQSMESWDVTLYADTPAPLEYGDFGLRDCGFDIPPQLVLVAPIDAPERPAIRTFMPAGPGRNAFSDLGLPRGGAPHAVDLVELWCTQEDEPAALYVQRSHPEGRRLSRFLIPLAAFPGDLDVRWRDFVRVFTPSGDLVTPELVRRNERNWDLLPPSDMRW